MSNTKGYTQILVGFERTSPRPLELNTVFDTYEDAIRYVKYNPTSYVGQMISVDESVYIVIRDGNSKSLDKVITNNGKDQERSNRYIYSHTNEVTLSHNLGYNPEVIFLDQDGYRLYPTIEYIDKDTIKLSWNGERSGSFYLV